MKSFLFQHLPQLHHREGVPLAVFEEGFADTDFLDPIGFLENHAIILNSRNSAFLNLQIVLGELRGQCGRY